MSNGGEKIVMSKRFLNLIEIKRKITNLQLELWDVTLVKIEQFSENLRLRIDSVALKIRSYIVDWIVYYIILPKGKFS